MPSIRERPVVRRAVRLNERYGEDAGGYLAASIAYYAFLSLFPLVLLALSVVGFVLASNPSARNEVREAVAGSVPGVRAVVGRNLMALERSRAGAGLLGLAGLLWTGTGVVGAGRNALRRVLRSGPPAGGILDKVRLVGLTAGLGVVALVATGLAGLAGGLEAEGPIGLLLRGVSATLSLALDVGLFALAYRALSSRGMTWRQILPGAVFAAVGWTLLKIFGTWYATWTVEGSESVYGTFAATIGVLVILYLAARLFVYGAELNAVLIEERGGGPMETDSTDGPRTRTGDVSTVRLVGQVAGDVGTLVKKEVELARQEIMEGVTARLKAAAAFAAIGVIAMFIVGFLAAAGAAALDLVLPTWAALLIVAGMFMLVAFLAFLFAKQRLKSPPLAPEQTKQTIKEDVEWAKAQLRR
ncbi:MAG: YhjD/YihY/BrkB family envelope integrity protein [Actinomycetota bacterium]